MKIALAKVRYNEVPFEIKADSIQFKGFLKPRKQHLVEIESQIEAKLELQCDRCGESFEKTIDEEIALLISDGTYEGEEQELDVVESLNGFIDIDEILDSEINLIKSDYHYCKSCQE